MKFVNFLISRLKSFIPAIEGIIYTIEHEKNTWIHIVATIIALIAIFALQLTSLETLFILSAIFIVWICEFFNTVIEYTLDFIQVDKNPKIKIIKDISAAGVLLSAIYAILTAVIIITTKFSN